MSSFGNVARSSAAFILPQGLETIIARLDASNASMNGIFQTIHSVWSAFWHTLEDDVRRYVSGVDLWMI